MVMSSDGEPSILAWTTHVKAGLARLHGVEVVAQESAVDDSEGHGLAEHAIREMQAKIRTLKKQAEELHKGELGVDHLNYRWWVELTATSIDIGRRGGQMSGLRGSCGMAVKRELVEGSGKIMVSLWWQDDVQFEGKFAEGTHLGPTIRIDAMEMGVALVVDA